MLITMTKEEIKEWDDRVKKLRDSKSRLENIVSILMNLHIGGHGNWESTAIEKAEAILKLLEE